MKKMMLVAVAFSMMSMGFAADKKADAKTDKMGKQVTVAGIVTDPMCAKSGDKAKMMDSDCAKKCMKDGKMAFVADKDGKVWSIDNPDALKGHEGHHVKVTGTANAADSTFHVSSAAMVPAKAEKKAKATKEEKKS